MGYTDRFDSGVLDPGFIDPFGVGADVSGGALRCAAPGGGVFLRRAEPVTGRVTIGFEQTYFDVYGVTATIRVEIGTAERLDAFGGAMTLITDYHDSRAHSRARVQVGDIDGPDQVAALTLYGDGVVEPGVPQYEDHDDVAFGPWDFGLVNGTPTGEVPYARMEQVWLTVEYNAGDGRIYGGVWTEEPPIEGGEADFIWASHPRQIEPDGDLVMAVYMADAGLTDPRVTLWRNGEGGVAPTPWRPAWPYETPFITGRQGRGGVMRLGRGR